MSKPYQRFMSYVFKLLFSALTTRKQQDLNLETIRPNQLKFVKKVLI